MKQQMSVCDKFDHQNQNMNQEQIHHHVNYCIYCHKNQGDFCRRGFPVKKREPELGFKHNPSDELLQGCPLDQRISEMHKLRQEQHILAALIMITRDNPMVSATGHRICNDCMKACIYQKQDPVDIPQIESQILRDVLSLPWGIEIYQLLIWWNPLRSENHLIAANQKAAIAVMGMGPAGFTMAQQMLIRGYQVTCFDGLTLRQLDAQFLNQPIRDFSDIQQPLSQRSPSGFGGVAEYGITVRWDKTYLTLIRIILERQKRFSMFGGIRFGGTITVEDIWELGYSHLVLAVGAGLPKALSIPNSLAPGMRQASDFLMNLQLTGAHKNKHQVNLDVSCPAVIIGGGLTGVDTATEVKAYYLQQVQNYQKTYQQIQQAGAEQRFNSQLSPAEKKLSKQWLADASALLAANEADYHKVADDISKVSILYRRSIQESPAYRKNPEELAYAMREGILYHDDLRPERLVLDENGHVRGLVAHAQQGEVHLDVLNVFVATGARPNIAYAYEHSKTFTKENGYYALHFWRDGMLVPDQGQHHMKSSDIGFLTSYEHEGRFVSVVGDAHPVFHGSVVGAIASSIRAAKSLDEILSLAPAGSVSPIAMPLVTQVSCLDDHWQLTIRSSLHEKNAKPGHLFRLVRLQENKSPVVAALADQMGDELVFYIPKNKMPELSVTDEVSIMGPSGVRMRIDDKGSIVLISDASGFLDLLSIYKAHQQLGVNVRWFHHGDINQFASLISQHQIQLQSADALNWSQLTADRIIVMGSSDLVKQASKFKQRQPDCEVTASVKGAAQCLLKGICAQCLQWQIDPVTMTRTKAVFACSWQNEPVELIDVEHLAAREQQTKLWEKASQFEEVLN